MNELMLLETIQQNLVRLALSEAETAHFFFNAHGYLEGKSVYERCARQTSQRYETMGLLTPHGKGTERKMDAYQLDCVAKGKITPLQRHPRETVVHCPERR